MAPQRTAAQGEPTNCAPAEGDENVGVMQTLGKLPTSLTYGTGPGRTSRQGDTGVRRPMPWASYDNEN